MSAAPKKAPKTESLTIRLDPKTRFILEFVARLRGQPLTTVVERFITDGANQISLDFQDGRTWREFWDVSEGMRALKMAAVPALYPTYEEERRLAFAQEHWPFFYLTDKKLTPRRVFVDILWPDIEKYMSVHEQKGQDYWRAGKLMQEALMAADVQPPAWPEGAARPKTGGFQSAKPAPPTQVEGQDDLDDEIPF